MIRTAWSLAVLLALASPARAEIGGVFRTAEPLGSGAFRLTAPVQYGGGEDFDFGQAHGLLVGGAAAYGLGDRVDAFVQAGYEFDDAVPFLKGGVQVALTEAGGGAAPALALRGYGYVFDFDAPDLAAVGATLLASWLTASDRVAPYAGIGVDAPLSGDGRPRLRDGDPDPVFVLGLEVRPRPRFAFALEGVHIGEPLVGAALSVGF